MKLILKVFKNLFLLIFLTSFALQAQKNNFVKGTVLMSKKKKIEAYILVDFTRPQNFQKQISYITPKDYQKFQSGKKLKSVREDIKAKDIYGFDLTDGRSFRTVKYVDLTKEGAGMLPKKLCLQQIFDGKIDMFKYYQHTGPLGSVGVSKLSNTLSEVIRESKKSGDQILIDHIESNFQLLAQKEHKMPKNVFAMNILGLIGDNPAVKQNYDNNHYGVQAYISGDLIPGLLAHENIEAAFAKMVGEYNGSMKAAK